MKKIYYNKLIRDKIPEKIKKSGGDSKTKKLKAKEFERELIKKVVEESDGLLAAKNKKEFVSELADVLDVIKEIKKLKKINNQKIRRVQKESNRIKGGFRKRLFLIWSEDTGYRSNERRYNNKKKQS